MLQRYPGLRESYQRLVSAELQRRAPPARLSSEAAAVETSIRLALSVPGAGTRLPECSQAPQPVYLWLYPDMNCNQQRMDKEPADNDEEETPEGEAVDKIGRAHV